MNHDESVFAGPSHESGINQLFFSATDSQGIITQANDVFADMVRMPREALIGAPHNINRHPGMPSGAFHLMWQTLASRRPFCAYVHNRASDGSRYPVFATITPLGDGYLSVRSKVCQQDLFDAATSLYEVTRKQELSALSKGMSRPDTALLGLGVLAPLLQQAGFDSYDEFTYTVLPAEVLARDEAGAEFPARPSASGALASALDASTRVHTRLKVWLPWLEELADVVGELTTLRHRMAGTVAEWTKQANAFAEIAATGGFRPILLSLSVWSEMSAEIGRMVEDVVPQLDDLCQNCAATRFRIALARLHNDALAQFLCELIDGGSAAARPAIKDLMRALSEGVDEARTQLNRNAESAARVLHGIGELPALFAFVTDQLTAWKAMASEHPDPIVAELAPRVDELIARGESDAASLQNLVDRLGELSRQDAQGNLRSEVALLAHIIAFAESEPTL